MLYISQSINLNFSESFTWNFRTLTTISQSKIAQTSPPPSINLVTVNLQYPRLPPTPKILRIRPKYGKYSKIKWRGGSCFFNLRVCKITMHSDNFQELKRSRGRLSCQLPKHSNDIQLSHKTRHTSRIAALPSPKLPKVFEPNIMRYLFWNLNYEKLKILIT